ncbi:hypothetical protein IEE91_03225 [Kocuria sp. cx-455]|uniref:hypothetical protein n=1 Tax=Kocuria sp. cx-455 TaxID=2771377 RepID=UPI0016820E0E|nr:hypothetical protein [Kocuria sp. cx-455]MBD2764222.1 hypothetical protein [Kocuria sp. cx-455]
MSRNTAKRIFSAAAVIFLVSGLLQLSRGFALGWAAVISASVIAVGLALATKRRWGRLIVMWGLLTGVAWLLTLPFGLIGWGYDFPYAGWITGIGMATVFYRQNRHEDRADPARPS